VISRILEGVEEFYEIVPRPSEGFGPLDEEDGFGIGFWTGAGTFGSFGILLEEVEIAGGSEVGGAGADGLRGEILVLDFFVFEGCVWD